MFAGGGAAQPADFEEFLDRRGAGLEQQRHAFRQFKSERDARFQALLDKRWEKFRVYRGLPPQDPEPKPRAIPAARPPEPLVQPLPQPPSKPAPTLRPTPSTPGPTPERPRPGRLELRGDFYGQSALWRLDDAWLAWRSHAPETTDQSAVSRFWGRFADLDSELLNRQLAERAAAWRLNDWGRAQLAWHLALKVSANREAALLTLWGLLLKGGYDVRLGRAQGRMRLLYGSRQKLYSTPYVQLDGKRYYVFFAADEQRGGSVGAVRSYRGDFAARPRPLDLSLRATPLLLSDGRARRLRFAYDGREHEVTAVVHEQLSRFFGGHPEQEVEAYFANRPSSELSASLLPQLRDIIRSAGPARSVELLLRFTQTAFAYQRDDEQFQRENYLLPEETLFHPASDCEDRTVLFAWLARELLGAEVIAVRYPGHIAAALRLPGLRGEAGAKRYAQWRKYRFEGEEYVLADPTFLRAGLGVEMPRFAGARPRLLAIPDYR